MESSDQQITWKIIPNTVQSRMKDRSFVHKLIPSRKLRRTNKVMNAKMKRHGRINTYSEYVIMKTSVLRDLSDNTDTDNSDNFTDDDFTLVYKSETSLTNYLMETSRYKYSLVKESKPDDTDLNDQEISKSEPRSDNTNLEWRKIKRKRTDLSIGKETIKDASCAKVDKDYGKIGIDVLDNHKLSLNKSMENALTKKKSISMKERAVELPTKVISSNAVAFHTTTVQKTETNSQLENHGESEPNVDHNSCLGNNSSVIDKKKDQVLKVQTFDTCSKYQPKDSGIEEDAEEECLLQSKKHYKKCKSESLQKKRSITKCTDDMTYPDDLKSESSNVLTTDSEDRVLCGSKDVMRTESSTEETQKRKLMPKVIHTEIVNKDYKIVLDTPSTMKSLKSEVLNATNSYDGQIHETEELECDTEDHISISTKKRLQQLKRLNLTTDTDSSSSENDETYSNNFESMRSKLFNRTLNSSDSSASESDTISFKRKISTVKRNERLSQSDNVSQQSDDCLNNENNSLKRYVDRCSVFPFKKHKRKTSNSNPVSTCNSDQEEIVKVTETNLENQTVEQIVNEEPVLQRPHDLQEFIENENLKLQIPVPSFRFKDIGEDDIFIVDIPSAVLEKQLVGKRMVLTENKLKFGKRKYRMECKDTGNLSCVVATGKSRKPYKAVNIKPMKRIVVRERLR
ncbi:uncharacterized protein LOC108628754 [Ceratina calcarata]|uniref:Uncharacterized protein LOC108628754 n=1 Tax=Ceratina calcarata TaxID=156304 RepID=A0AAJ7J800_9HYME|nr:uncharacterized protein LOC108628754 [Ceratina calcarata]